MPSNRLWMSFPTPPNFTFQFSSSSSSSQEEQQQQRGLNNNNNNNSTNNWLAAPLSWIQSTIQSLIQQGLNESFVWPCEEDLGFGDLWMDMPDEMWKEIKQCWLDEEYLAHSVLSSDFSSTTQTAATPTNGPRRRFKK